MSTKTKVAGSVVAGFPSPAEQYQEPPLDLNELLVKRPAATYFVRVEGDSMIGAGIHDGDLLVVDRSLSPASGDVIIASVDGDFTVKTYRRDKEGIRLEPANPSYPVIKLKPNQSLDYFGNVSASLYNSKLLPHPLTNSHTPSLTNSSTHNSPSLSIMSTPHGTTR